MSNASSLKLKEKIAKLEKDINTLVFHPDSYEANLIRAKKGAKKDISGTFKTPKESIEAFTQ